MKAKTNIKKALSLLLAVVMVCSAMTLGILAAPLYETTGDTVTVTVPNGTETPDSYICTVVTTKAELTEALAAGQSVILGQSIDMGGDKITTAITMADGTLLEGNGYSLYHFSLGSNAILTFAGKATVQNLTIGTGEVGGLIQGTKGLFGSPTGTTVTYNNVEVFADIDGTHSIAAWGIELKGNVYMNGCTANGTVTSTRTAPTSNANQNRAFGGFFGWCEGDGTTVSMVNCVNNVDVEGLNSVGGFFGLMQKKSIVMKGCVNNGTITGKASSGNTVWGYFVGGMIGSLYDVNGTNQSILLEGCKNKGAVLGVDSVAGMVGGTAVNSNQLSFTVNITTCHNYGAIQGNANVAGLLGYIKKNNFTGTINIDGCANYGEIFGNKGYGTGGFIGNVEQNTGSIAISNSENVGTVTNSAGNAGGFVGDCGSTTLRLNNCLNRGAVNAKHAVGAVMAGGAKLTIDGFINIGAITASGNYLANITGNGTIASVKNSYGFGRLSGTANTNSAYLCAQGASEYANNKYLSVDGFTPKQKVDAAAGIVDETTLGFAVADMAAAVDLLNTKYTDLDFAVGTDNAIYVTTPVLQGSQETVAENDLQKVRFLATINANGTALKSIGFKVSYSFMDNGQKVERGLVEGQPSAVSCERIYRSIKAVENGKTYSYSAASLGGDYIYALSIAGVPTNKGEVTFTVTPFTVDQNDKEVTGQGWTVVYNGGEFVSATKISAVSQ